MGSGSVEATTAKGSRISVINETCQKCGKITEVNDDQVGVDYLTCNHCHALLYARQTCGVENEKSGFGSHIKLPSYGLTDDNYIREKVTNTFSAEFPWFAFCSGCNEIESQLSGDNVDGWPRSDFITETIKSYLATEKSFCKRCEAYKLVTIYANPKFKKKRTSDIPLVVRPPSAKNVRSERVRVSEHLDEAERRHLELGAAFHRRILDAHENGQAVITDQDFIDATRKSLTRYQRKLDHDDSIWPYVISILLMAGMVLASSARCSVGSH